MEEVAVVAQFMHCLHVLPLTIIISKRAVALGEGGNVPFRESTLTKLLKESLGGNSKTALLCTTSRKDAHLEETL